jgi:hypothetical protein
LPKKGGCVPYCIAERPGRGEHLCAFRVRSSSLDFVQESVIFLHDGAVKSTLAPAQRITGIVTYRGMEMRFSALLDEFNYIFDGHRNLLINVDDVATIEFSPSLL